MPAIEADRRKLTESLAEGFFNLLRWLAALPRPAKQVIVIGNDLTCCFLAILIAWALRMEVLAYWNRSIALLTLTALPTSVAIFSATGVYQSVFRYAGLGMLRTLARSFAVYGAFLVTLFVLISTPQVPRSLGVLQPIFFFALVLSTRIGARYFLLDLLGRGNFRGQVRTVLIYGAGIAGQQLASSIAKEPSMRFVGYIDDDARLDGRRLDGARVSSVEKLASLIRRYDVSDVFLAMPSLSRAQRRQVVEHLEPYPVYVRTLPQISEMVEGKVSVSDVRELDIQDLLGREPVRANELLLGRTVAGKTVPVTGAGGSIGSELCRQIVQIGARRLVLFERSEFGLYSIEAELHRMLEERGLALEVVPLLGSVTDEARLSFALSKYRPDTVFHAAAYKHVPLVEANPVEGIQNNVLGTLATAKAAVQTGVRDFILISTDKAVRPTNVMGATKRSAELIIQAFAARKGETKFSMVRFGNVLGSSGSVVPLFREQIRQGGPITLTHSDVTRYFMTIPEAAELVIQAAGLAKGGEVFVLDMGEPVRIKDLALSMIRLSGLSPRDASNPNGDIAIVEVGLRSGEKLYEELLIGASPQATAHSRIFMARENRLAWDDLEPLLAKLAVVREREEAIALLKRLVPEFAQENQRSLAAG